MFSLSGRKITGSRVEILALCLTSYGSLGKSFSYSSFFGFPPCKLDHNYNPEMTWILFYKRKVKSQVAERGRQSLDLIVYFAEETHESPTARLQRSEDQGLLGLSCTPTCVLIPIIYICSPA